MKDELIKSLKTKYSTLGFGDKAFEAVADFLSKSITEKDQIETATSGVDSLLKAFQGNEDRLRTENANLKKQLREKEGQETVEKQGEHKATENKYLTREEFEEALTSFKTQTVESQAKAELLSSKINSAKTKLGLKDTTFKVLLKNIENIEALSEDELVSRLQKDHDAIKSEITPEAGRPTMATLSNGNQVPTAIADFIKEKQAEIQASSETKPLV